MSVRKRTSIQDWIQDYYSPVLSVLASQDVEIIAGKNNLTFTEILQPFSKLGTDVTIKDVDGSNHNVPNLHLILQDLNRDSPKLINQKLLLERLSEENCEESEMVTKHYDKISLDAPGFTPWFDLWMKLYLQTLPVVEHEYLKHQFGCIFAVSTQCSNPVEQLRTLSQVQHKYQHDRIGSNTPYFSPNILKYYILVHDVNSGITDMQAENMFTQIQNAFDANNCHLLHLNSRNIMDESSPSPNPVAENWIQFSHRFTTVELRRGSSQHVSSPNPITRIADVGKTTKDSVSLEHPLAVQEPVDSPVLPTNQIILTQATSASIAECLSPSDLDRIRSMMRELVLKVVIPFAEKQMKQIHEIVVNRKSRSLFSGAKRWFGSNKTNPGAAGTSVIYSKDAPELQVRKLADLYFLMKMYKQSYNLYYTAKKDFQVDEAWPYYAPAVELTALAMFMISLSGADQGKKYRPDYMEDAITKYLTLCQTPEFAIRATLFDALCLKQQGMFVEASKSYIRMTNELSDLRSAMLLEQAGYCFLLSNPPSVRKYGFHIVLSGYRFTKTGSCKKHAARLYRQGAQVYDGKGWLLSSEHILYSLGHQKFMLKDFSTSSEFFNNLMSVSTGRNPLQQMVHLREYFLVHHARHKEDQSVVVLTVPKIICKQLSVSLNNNMSQIPKHWQAVERCIVEGITGQEILVHSQTSQQHFTESTENHLTPQGVVGEKIFVTVPFENSFNNPLVLRRSMLLWRFTTSQGEVFSNDKQEKTTSAGIQATPLESVSVESNSSRSVVYEISGSSPGVLNIIGVEYSLKPSFPDREPTDHEIRGKQYFQITGRRQNAIKDHKTKIVQAQDHRLTVNIRDPQPLLTASLSFPENLLAGELRCIELDIKNIGSMGLKNLHIVSTVPGIFSFGKPRSQSMFEYPLLEKQYPPLRILKEDGSVSQTCLDILSVPLSESLAGELKSQTSAKLPVWIKGPSTGPDVVEDVYLYYENSDTPDKKLPYRILHIPLRLRILPSLQSSALSYPTAVHENIDTLNLILRLKNVTKDGTGCLENIQISQVTLVSVERELSSIESTGTCANVSRGDSVAIALKSVIIEKSSVLNELVNLPMNQNKELKGGSLHFSSLATPQNKGHSISSPPFVDFLKPFFSFNLGRKTNPPFLKTDIVVLMWRGVGSQPVLGQTILLVKSKPFDSRTEETEIPFPHYPVNVEVEYDRKILHDFSRNPFAGVRVRVGFSGQDGEKSGEGGILLQFCLQDVERGIRWTGVTDGMRWIKQDGLVLNLGVNVSRPGLFHLRNLKFRAVKLKNFDMRYFETHDEPWSCVDLSFTVHHE